MQTLNPVFDWDREPFLAFVMEKIETDPFFALFATFASEKSKPIHDLSVDVTVRELGKYTANVVAWVLQAVIRGTPAFKDELKRQVAKLIDMGGKGEDVINLLDAVVRYEFQKDAFVRDASARTLEKEMGFKRKKMASFLKGAHAEALWFVDHWQEFLDDLAVAMDEASEQNAPRVLRENETERKGPKEDEQDALTLLKEVRSAESLRETSIEDPIRGDERQSAWAIAEKLYKLEVTQALEKCGKFLEAEGLCEGEIRKFREKMTRN